MWLKIPPHAAHKSPPRGSKFPAMWFKIPPLLCSRTIARLKQQLGLNICNIRNNLGHIFSIWTQTYGLMGRRYPREVTFCEPSFMIRTADKRVRTLFPQPSLTRNAVAHPIHEHGADLVRVTHPADKLRVLLPREEVLRRIHRNHFTFLSGLSHSVPSLNQNGGGSICLHCRRKNEWLFSILSVLLCALTQGYIH